MDKLEPVFTVVGLKKSVGSFTSDDGRVIDYNNIVVITLVDFSDKEIKAGAVGLKVIEHKIKGTAFFDEYVKNKLPAKAKFNFDWDFSGKLPKANLISLDFSVKD